MEQNAVHQRIADTQLSAAGVVHHRADDIDANRGDTPGEEQAAPERELESEAVILDLEPPRQPATVHECDEQEGRRELDPVTPVEDEHERGHEEKELRAPSQVAA